MSGFYSILGEKKYSPPYGKFASTSEISED